MSDLNTAFDMFLPHRVIRKHPTDHPWITTKIKNRSIGVNLHLFIKERTQWLIDFGEIRCNEVLKLLNIITITIR